MMHFISADVFGLFIGFLGTCIVVLIFAIVKMNKRIHADTTAVEIETAKLVEIELRSRERTIE